VQSACDISICAEAGEQPCCRNDHVSFVVVGSTNRPDAVLNVRHAGAPPNIHARLPPEPRNSMRSSGQVFAVIDDALQSVEDIAAYWVRVPFAQFGAFRPELLDMAGKVRKARKSLNVARRARDATSPSYCFRERKHCGGRFPTSPDRVTAKSLEPKPSFSLITSIAQKTLHQLRTEEGMTLCGSRSVCREGVLQRRARV
jgi:hypothetical protein